MAYQSAGYGGVYRPTPNIAQQQKPLLIAVGDAPVGLLNPAQAPAGRMGAQMPAPSIGVLSRSVQTTDGSLGLFNINQWYANYSGEAWEIPYPAIILAQRLPLAPVPPPVVPPPFVQPAVAAGNLLAASSGSYTVILLSQGLSVTSGTPGLYSPARFYGAMIRTWDLPYPTITLAQRLKITPPGTATLTGTIIGALVVDIIVGGKTIILTLSGTTWVAAGATFNAERQNIINGLLSAQSDTHGWNADVIAALAVTDVVRTSAAVVTITLPAVATYAILASETITATIPMTAIVQGSPIIAVPAFTISVASTGAAGTARHRRILSLVSGHGAGGRRRR